MKTLSNTQAANRRTWIVIGIVAICTLLSIFGIYPSNYESLFTPLNKGIEVIIWASFVIGIGCLFSKKKIQGEKAVSNISFLHLIVTLGLACGFFSYVINPDFIIKYNVGDPYQRLIHWYGPTQWVLFVPFLLVEIGDAEGKIPQWLSSIKTYLYAVSMMLAIGISLMAGCNSIPKIINTIWGVQISPYLMITPIAALIGLSLVRGIHKGMRVFSTIAMTTLYIITASLISLCLTKEFIPYAYDSVIETYREFFNWNHYKGSVFEVEQVYPFWIWMFTWAGIVSPFVHKIAAGRTLRNTVLFMVIGPSVVCMLYALIASYSFGQYNGGGFAIFSDHSWLGVLYVIMLVLMFVTSADSTCYSIDMMISKGSKAPVAYRKLLWVFVMCVFITLLMIAGGGSTNALYGISYITAPLIIIVGIVSLCIIAYKNLKVVDWKLVVNKLKFWK